METTSQPKVSVLLPNLNNRPFLAERFETIFNQTLADWELIVVDSYSDDGAWELIQAFAAKDERIHIVQAPRKGVYAGINHCISLARGEYIYIATSDDTMMPQCLEKMVEALDTHSECDICHCCLQVINEKGEAFKNWWRSRGAANFYGELIDRQHIRLAPYDGILACGLDTVYLSLTQLLIRRSVFDKVGLFRADWGPKGDFEWGMRAALVCNTIHLPETLATWRMHSQQATTADNHQSSQHRVQLMDMVTTALPILEKHNPRCYQKLRFDRLLFIYRRQQLRLSLKEASQWNQKLKLSLTFFWQHPQFFIEFLYRRFLFSRDQSDDFVYIQEELKWLGLDDSIKLLS